MVLIKYKTMKRRLELTSIQPSDDAFPQDPVNAVNPITSVTPSRPLKKRKKYIPKCLRIAVWQKNIGLEIGTTPCMVCKVISINQMDFHCGHIVSEADGGDTCLSNLKPVCAKCNYSMGRKNLTSFQQKYFK